MKKKNEFLSVSAVNEDIRAKREALDKQAKEKAKVSRFKPEVQSLIDNSVQRDEKYFRKRAGLKPKEKMSQGDKIIAVVDEMREQLDNQGSGITRYNEANYLYFGGYWHEFKKHNTTCFLKKEAIKIGLRESEVRYYKRVNELYDQFVSITDEDVYSNQGEVSEDAPGLFNFQNGTMEIDKEGNLTFREHRREDFLRFCLPFEYNPEAKAPMFMQYLNRVLPKTDCQKVLAEYLGNVFFPGLNLQKMLVLLGTGNNGKSVILKVVKALLGGKKNVSECSITQLTSDNGYYVGMLDGKLLNICDENRKKTINDTAILKKIARNEPITVRNISKSPFDMTHYARVVFSFNRMPETPDTTEGFFRSFLIIPFKEHIAPGERDIDLPKKIIATELPGVLNWALEGLLRLIKNKAYSPCEDTEYELNRYKRDADIIMAFLSERDYHKAKKDKKYEKTVKQLYKEFTDYCSECGYRNVPTRGEFSKALEGENFLIGPKYRNSAGYVTYVCNSAQADFDDMLEKESPAPDTGRAAQEPGPDIDDADKDDEP